MHGLRCQSSRRAHPFFALFAVSLFSIIALVSRRPSPPHYVHSFRRQPFARAVTSLNVSSIPTFNQTTAKLAGLLDVPSSSPSPSPPSSILPPPITSSPLVPVVPTTTPPTTTSSRTTTTPTPGPLPTSSTPTTTISTSPTISTTSTTPSSLSTDVTPSTTIIVSDDDSATSKTTRSSANPSSTGTSSKSTSGATEFWDNKGAVVATFLLVSLLALGFAIMIVTTILRRRRASREALIDAEFMPHYREPRSRGSSPTPSISSAPLDPFKSRDVVHDYVPTGLPVASTPLVSQPLTSPSRELPIPLPSRVMV